MQIIKWTNLSHIYAKGSSIAFKALDNISGAIEDKKIYSIIGNTGSGKSTLIQHFNALLKPTDGTIEIHAFVKNYNKKTKQNDVEEIKYLIKNSRRRIKKAKNIRRTIGLVFQFPEYQLFKDTVKNDIMFGPLQMGVQKEEAEKRAIKYLELVGLDKSYLDRNPFGLSGGQKRRVAVAGILAMEPEVLVLDEPTAGLDPQGEHDMMQLFKRIHETGKTVVIVTHNMDHVLEYSDEVFVMLDGKIIAKGQPNEIYENEELIVKAKLNFPLVYEFMRKMKSEGFDTSKLHPKNVEDLANQIAKQMKHKGGKE